MKVTYHFLFPLRNYHLNLYFLASRVFLHQNLDLLGLLSFMFTGNIVAGSIQLLMFQWCIERNRTWFQPAHAFHFQFELLINLTVCPFFQFKVILATPRDLNWFVTFVVFDFGYRVTSFRIYNWSLFHLISSFGKVTVVLVDCLLLLCYFEVNVTMLICCFY